MRSPSLAACVLVAAIVAACGSSAPVPLPAVPIATGVAPATPVASETADTASPTATGVDAAARVAGWSADLDLLLPGFERIHPQPFHSASRDVLAAAIENLRASIPTASDDELMTGVLRIVALVSASGRDSHTGAYVWGSGSYPTHTLPLRLWRFPSGWVVVDAMPPYADLVGRRVTSVDGRPIEDVVATLDPLIPRDNDQTVTLLLPRFLLTTEILRGAGVIEDPGHVTLGLDAAEPVTVDAIPTVDYNAWATPYGLFLPTRPDVPSLARSEEPLWFEVDGDTLYVQYNRVVRLPATDIEALGAALDDPAVDRVIVDIRHNYGGETSGYPPVADAIVERAARWPGTLFLITGRNTYSAGTLFAASLLARTGITVVGEPMGGSPNLYGNARDIALPYSGINVAVSTALFEGLPGDDRLLIEPEIPAVYSVKDYAAGRDAALAAIDAVGR